MGPLDSGIIIVILARSIYLRVERYQSLSSVSANIAVGVVWGIAFFILGMLKTIRREM